MSTRSPAFVIADNTLAEGATKCEPLSHGTGDRYTCDMSDLSHLATPKAEILVRVTPKASRNAIKMDGDQIRVYVTVAPEGGKANAAVQKLLAKALGVAKSRLTLVRGQTSRDKVFRVD